MNRIPQLTFLLGVAAIVCLPGSLKAELWPSFDLGYSAEHATHIVVVDRKGKILESLRGDLPVGEKLPLAGNPKPIPVDYDLDFPVEIKGQEEVKTVTGNRRVMFLIQGKDRKAFAPANVNEPDFQLATVWIEAGQSFAIYQIRNPGTKSNMHPLFLSEAQLKTQIEKFSTPPTAKAKDKATPDAKAILEPDLSGPWRLLLPAGYEHEITLRTTEPDEYRFDSAGLTFSGQYCLEDDQLVSAKTEDRKGQYFWKVNSPYLLTLTKETVNNGSDYTGAVLFRKRPGTAPED